jgi:hypothetical protein
MHPIFLPRVMPHSHDEAKAKIAAIMAGIAAVFAR